MRKILCRGKRIIDDQWAFGNYSFKSDIRDDKHCINRREVYRETVGQYIGLEDKNGKRIFEGDIIRMRDALPGYENYICVGVVGFDYASFMIDDDCMKHYRWMDYECEIIGNIHDNPELMEKEEHEC